MKHRRSYNRNGRRHNNYNRDRGGQRENNNRQNTNNNQETQRHNNFSNNKQQIQNVLPDPEILQEYEYAAEGTVAKLMEIASVEQERRHLWEDEYMRFHKKSVRLGQFFGFIMLLSIIWGSIYLGSMGHEKVAIFLSVSAFSAITITSLFVEISRRLARRPRKDRR